MNHIIWYMNHIIWFKSSNYQNYQPYPKLGFRRLPGQVRHLPLWNGRTRIKPGRMKNKQKHNIMMYITSRHDQNSVFCKNQSVSTFWKFHQSLQYLFLFPPSLACLFITNLKNEDFDNQFKYRFMLNGRMQLIKISNENSNSERQFY